MTLPMTRELVPFFSADLVDSSVDPLFRKLAELYNDPEVVAAVSALRLKIIERLLGVVENPQGIEFVRDKGEFIFSGIRTRLQRAQNDLAAINIEMVGGDVELLDNEGIISIGKISIPRDSQWAKQDFINTNPLDSVARFTFTPICRGPSIDPRIVTKNSEGAEFLLDEREAIAAQILMVVNSALVYRNLAVSALEEEEVVLGLKKMKFAANTSDLIDALEYAVRLKEELRTTVVQEDPSERMIRGMSAAANLPGSL